MANIRMVGFDADDTLWRSQDWFDQAQLDFEAIIAGYVNGDARTSERLYAVEKANLAVFGYGVKGMALSMIESAIDITGGRISGADVHRILALAKDLLRHPVELLPGVREAVEAVAAELPVVMITKGDLFHQEQKFAASGLDALVDRVEVVSEKDVRTYRSVIGRVGVDPSRFLMVGNSVRSDVLPPIEAGGHAAHVPYEITWVHEHVDDAPVAFPVLPSLSAFADWITTR